MRNQISKFSMLFLTLSLSFLLSMNIAMAQAVTTQAVTVTTIDLSADFSGATTATYKTQANGPTDATIVGAKTLTLEIEFLSGSAILGNGATANRATATGSSSAHANLAAVKTALGTTLAATAGTDYNLYVKAQGATSGTGYVKVVFNSSNKLDVSGTSLMMEKAYV